MSGNYRDQWQVKSQSGKGTHYYTVSERFDGTWECSCMNWTRTMPRQDCKHILMKKLELQKPAPIKVEDKMLLAPPTGRKFR